jgi:hypothetical protein
MTAASRKVAPLLVATLIAGLMPAASFADNSAQAANSVTPSGFDWLANGSDLDRENALEIARERQILAATQMGDGSWICSPAGFGRKSQCYSN